MQPDKNQNLSSNFHRLAWSNLFAQSAEQIALAAAPLVAVLALGATASQVGWLQFTLTLPFLLVAIPAGLLADRMRRQKLMACAETVRAVSLAGLVMLLVFGQLTLQSLAVLGLIGVCGTVVFTVAAPALVPSIVPSALFGRANARLELAGTSAFVAGPAIGGALVGWTGASIAFGLATCLSIWATVLLGGVSEPTRKPVTGRHPFREIYEGAAFVFRNEFLAPVFATQFIFNAAFFVLMAIFVLRALAARKLLRRRKPPCGCAARKPVIYAYRSENKVFKGQVADKTVIQLNGTNVRPDLHRCPAGRLPVSEKIHDFPTVVVSW